MKKITKKQTKKLEKRQTNKKFKEWAKVIKERDGNKCVICGKTERLNACHIIPKFNKLFQFDIYNGISCCPFHHNFSREISLHKNPFAFFLWFLENRKEQYEYLKDKLENEPKDF